ncbi:hypothetical protein ACFFRR_007654 [Megaselia abdita]
MVEIQQNLKICNLHFEEKFFIYNQKGHKRLTELAYPNRNLPDGVEVQDLSDDDYEDPKINIIKITEPLMHLSNHRKSTDLPNKIETIYPLENITNSGNTQTINMKNLRKVKFKPISKKKVLEDPTKPKLVLKDGKVLTPIKLKPKAAKQSFVPKKDRSIIMLEDGVIVFKNTVNDSINSLNYSEFIHENSSLNVTNQNIQRSSVPDYFIKEIHEESNQQIQETMMEHIEEHSKIIPTIPESPKVLFKDESPKVLFKDGKVLKQVKFKKKKNPHNDSLQLPSFDPNQSTHLVEYMHDFNTTPNLSVDMMYVEEMPLANSMQEMPKQENDVNTSANSIDYIPDDIEFEATEDGHMEEFEMEETPEEVETISLENGVKIQYQALNQYLNARGRPRKNNSKIIHICSVPGCGVKKRSETTEDIGFMFLRNNCRRFWKWVEVIKVKQNPYPKTLKICFKHFKKSDILINHAGKQRIHPTAVPSLYLPDDKPKEIVTKQGLVLKPVKFRMPVKNRAPRKQIFFKDFE